MDRFVLVSHDAGGAGALMPVARLLRRAGAAVAAVVAGPSADLWPIECPEVECLPLSDKVGKEEALRVLRERRAQVLFSASGLYNQIEHTFRLAAAARGTPVAAVLDSWDFCRERFERTARGARQLSHPQLVCALDRYTREELRQGGFPPERIVVTGPPNLEASLDRIGSMRAEQRALGRASFGIGADDLLITFFSDSFFRKPDGRPLTGTAGAFREDGLPRWGYLPGGILQALLEDLEAAARSAGRRCHLIVKPHPMEDDASIRRALKRGPARAVTASVHSGRPASHWIALSDAAAGMMSIALLEAGLAGKPALAVQMGLTDSGEPDPSVSNRLGYSHAILRREQLRTALLRLCRGDLAPAKPPNRSAIPITGAARRVVEALSRFASRSRRPGIAQRLRGKTAKGWILSSELP